MPMTKKDISRRMRQLQIEFPDEHLRKYWVDNNIEMSVAEIKYSLEGRMRCWNKERGWHYTRKHKGPEQFPIELHWIWHEPL